ncbi:riboflavin kinase [Actinomortierella wolfii]|nr:riboflavin kinase [Actinomortierella wolfii]
MTADSTASSAPAVAVHNIVTSGPGRPRIVGGDKPSAPFPLRMKGPVVKGFGRGSKDLGIPTGMSSGHGTNANANANELGTNLPEEAIAEQEKEMDTGIYYGWAQVVVNCSGSSQGGDESSLTKTDEIFTVYPMVMSLGWNPFYKNEKKSAEVHIMHKFENDFYGDELRVVVLGYIRPELDYTTLDALIQDINIDIEVAQNSLARPVYAAYKNDPLFLVK